MSKFTLRDTFNNVNVSHHRTMRAALQAEQRLLRNVRRYNGPISFTTEILCDGKPMTSLMIDEANDIKINLQARR